MKLSVIIPAHNAEAFLQEALDSVRQQSWQGSQEIIVFNDGSTDGTAEVARRAGVVLLETEVSVGAAAARNACVQASRGEYLAFLDADDLWMPTKLGQQFEVLHGYSGPAAVFGLTQEFDASGPRGDFRPSCLTTNCLVSRADFDLVGPFDESLKLAEFAEWLSRAEDKGLALLKPEIKVGRRRIHGGNSGVVKKDQRKDYLEVARRRLARRRAESDS